MTPYLLQKKRNTRRDTVFAVMMLLPVINCFAKSITTTKLLESLKPGEPWDKGVLTSTKAGLFIQTASGSTDATVITATQLGFFTSSNCSGSLAGTNFYTTPTTHSFPISIGKPFGLTAAAIWHVGTNKLHMSTGTMGTIQSIAMTFKTTAMTGAVAYEPQSNFSGSSFACIQVSCSSGECIAFSGTPGTQDFTLKTTAVIGDPADGGVIACMNGGKNNLVVPTTDNTTSVTWGGSGTTTTATSTSDGATNTITIVTALGSGSSYAARTCSTYSAAGGFTSGWFLPAGNNLTTTGQLNCLFTNRAAIGGFGANNNYWSSTEGSSTNAWNQAFLNGDQNSILKTTLRRVRCSRALTL